VVTVDAAKAMTATFDVLSFTLSVGRSGTGSGTVTSSPAGIDCGTDCSESYLFGTAVGLTATPASGSLFTGWTGDCSGSGTCTVTLDAPRAVTATFTAGPVNLDFYTVTPCRVLDTRTGSGPITSGGVLVFAVSGSCGIPSDAWAVTLNLTVIGATGNGNVVLFPGNAAPPPTSTINFAAGLTLANNAILALSSDGAGSLAAKAIVAGSGTVDVIVDVNGYFQ
jgi:hypothetical protein